MLLFPTQILSSTNQAWILLIKIGLNICAIEIAQIRSFIKTFSLENWIAVSPKFVWHSSVQARGMSEFCDHQDEEALVIFANAKRKVRCIVLSIFYLFIRSKESTHVCVFRHCHCRRLRAISRSTAFSWWKSAKKSSSFMAPMVTCVFVMHDVAWSCIAHMLSNAEL